MTASPRSARRSRVVATVAALCTIEVLGYLAATRFVSANGTSGKILGDVVYPLMEAAAAVMLGLAAVRASGRRRAFFGWLAAATAAGLCGDVTWAVLVLVFHRSPTPSPADAFYIVGLALLAPALWVEFGSPARRWRELLDVSMIMLVLAYLTITLVVRPEIGSIAATDAPAIAETVLATVAGLWAISAVLVAPRRPPIGLQLVTWGIVAQAASWIAYSYVFSVRGVQDGSWTYTGWQATWALLIVGAVVELIGDQAGSGTERPRRGPNVWVTAAGFVLLIGLILIWSPFRRTDPLAVTVGVTGVGIVLARLHLSLRERDRLNERLREMAETDALTGVSNRRVFDARLRSAADSARATGRPVGVLAIDIDRFKLINDRHGHATGDRVLQLAATRLAAAVRPDDLLSRTGGEEFAVLALGITPASITTLAERCRRAMAAEPAVVDGTAIPITISVGAACMPGHAEHTDELLRVADHALYEAKSRGRNRIHVGVARAVHESFEAPDGGILSHLEQLAGTLDGDPKLRRHAEAMADVTARLCKRMGVSAAQRRRCLVAASLHDIGRVGTPRHILAKPGPLSAAEMMVVRDHVRTGVDLLLAFPETHDLAGIVRDHHEHVDGSGYPEGRHGDEISIEARVIAVAAAWTAMRADRPHRPALTAERARAELLRRAGGQFDTSVVAALLDLLDHPDAPAGHRPTRSAV